MPLNLATIEGKIDRPQDVEDGEFYQIYPDHPAYRYFWQICLSVNAMTLAIGVVKEEVIPDDGYLGLSGKAFDYVVRVPAFSCVQMALSENEPQCIPFRIEWRRKEDAHMTWASQLRRWMNWIIWPGFVDLYEENKTKIHKGDPGIAGMAKVFRDASAHGGRIKRSKSRGTPASWSGLTVTDEDHNRPLSDLAGYGDFLILAIAMFDSALKPVQNTSA
jgi:hypothetical protein